MENLVRLQKKFGRTMLLAYALVSVVVYVACLMLCKSDKQQMTVVLLASFILLWSFAEISSNIYFRQLKKSPEGVARYYMVETLSRLVFGGLLMLLISYIIGPNYKMMLIGFCAFFLITLVCESYMYIYIEKQLNLTNDSKQD